MLRWRRIDLKRQIETMLGVALHDRTVGKQLAALGFRRLSLRPQHPKANAVAQEAFKKLPDAIAAALPEKATGKPIELWFEML